MKANFPSARPRPYAFPAVVLALAIAAALPDGAQAIEIENSVEGLKLNWNTTLKYSNAFRLKNQAAGLVGNPNLDDGDRNFNRGLISNRIDVLTELDAVYGDGGVRFSGAGWWDQIYNRHNDNPGLGTSNHTGAYNEFPSETSRLHGRKAELLDAFAFKRFETPGGTLSVRLGQHALLWGESLFFGSNAIAGAQMPFDVSKLLSVPGTQFKEVIRPVPQVSAQLNVSSDVSVGAYYQFRFEPNRFPAVGSYFSQLDTAIDGAERLLLPSPLPSAPRQPDMRPKNSGQGGLQLKLRAAETDLGFYAVRFHQKSPQLVPWIGLVPPVGPVPVGYMLAYHQGTTAFGASVSKTFGDVNLAAEASIRRNQDLASGGHADLRGLGLPATDNAGNPAYAVGKTAHFNTSAVWTVGPGPLWREAMFMGEVAWNRVLSCDRNCARNGTLDPTATRDGTALRFILTPSYRQVIPGLDLDVPIGVGYSPNGSRPSALGSPGAFSPEGGGDFSIGLNGTWEQVWRFSLGYTHFFGKGDTWLTPTNNFTHKQFLKDRDFVAFSVQRSF